MSAEIELAVQARRRLVGDEEAAARRAWRTSDWSQPDRMARTVGIAEACDRLREDLDASARRAAADVPTGSSRKRRRRRRRPAVAARSGCRAAQNSSKSAPAGPAPRGRSAGRLIEVLQPLAGVRPSVKAFARRRAARRDRQRCRSRRAPRRTASATRCMATSSGSLALPPISSRSSVMVQGSTISACRAVAVQASSCTTSVSTRAKALRRRLRSWWWWKGLPPAQ